jgi:hypothetical protein
MKVNYFLGTAGDVPDGAVGVVVVGVVVLAGVGLVAVEDA